MKYDMASYAKMFTPGLIGRAVQAFDKATMLIVSVSWGGALILLLFALYTLNLSAEARRQVVEAASLEPSLPQIVTRAPEKRELSPIVDRLQKRFADINFILGSDQSLTVTAVDGARFRTWLTVLSYIDTISPQYRWQMKEFCVGMGCGSSTPMKAVLSPQKITFSAPKEKD